MIVDDSFKLHLLLDCLRITCRYHEGDEQICAISDTSDFEDCHIACNCGGDIKRCDLPEKFQVCL